MFPDKLIIEISLFPKFNNVYLSFTDVSIANIWSSVNLSYFASNEDKSSCITYISFESCLTSASASRMKSKSDNYMWPNFTSLLQTI